MIKLEKCWLFNKKIILLILLLLLSSIILSNAQNNIGKNTNDDQSSMFLLQNDNDKNNSNINFTTNNNITDIKKSKTDNIFLNETEKPLKVQRSTDSIALNDTFMNENQNVRNLLPYMKNDSETISINNNLSTTITNTTTLTLNDKIIIENNLKLPFEEFLLDENNEDEHFLNNKTNNNTLNDSENIYRIAKIKRKINYDNDNDNNNKIQSNVIINNHRVKHSDDDDDDDDGDNDITDDHIQDDFVNIKTTNKTNLIQFQLITHLFDHLQWNNTEIQQILGDPQLLCSQDIQKYLNAIYNEESWALKVMDSSGRYRGQLFFGNNLWMGARRFCYQIEKDFTTDKDKPVKMGFFVTKMLIPISDRLVENQPLFIGQCLPNSCTIDDIQKILEVDPSAKKFLQSMELNGNNSSTSKTTFKILNVRKVPGNYNLWMDRKFYFLLLLLSIISVFVIIGTILEFSNNKKSTKSETSLLTKNSLDMINNNQNNNHNNNNNINNNGSKMLDNDHNSSKLFNEHFNHKNNNNNNNNRIDMELNGCDRDLNDDIKIEHDDINNVKSKRKCGIFRQILASFDLIANSKSILSTNGVTENTVACVHGMRFFSMLWIIMVHSYLSLYAKSENKYSKNLTERSFWYQLVGNATYSVDTFFYISGLLVTLLFLRAEKLNMNKRSISSSVQKVILAVFYRFIRLTPALIFVIIFTEVTLKYSINNAVFPPSLVDHLICPQYWWRTLLYIQNWYPFAELCMSWSWYLANDMQFFIFAIIVLLISTRFLKTSFTIVIIFLILSWITTALVSLSYNYRIRISEPLDSFGFLYDRPWTRLGPYIMGMLAGYIIYKVNKPPKLSTIVNFILWIASIAIIFIVVFGIWNGSLDIHTTALYFSLSHTAWGLALIWITLACKWKLAIYIDNFLSFKIFLPFSRLTYCVYLIHPITQVIVANNLDGALNIQHSFILTIFLGNSIIAYSCAFLISLFFEAPLVKVLRIFYRR